MHEAIEVGMRLGPMLAKIFQPDLDVYAFDIIPHPVEGVDKNPATWERAFAGMASGGSTSCSVSIEMMRRRNQRVEQVVMVTGEDENTEPFFVKALLEYASELKCPPYVLFVKTRGASTQLEAQCLRSKIPVKAYQFSGDFCDLLEIVPLLARPRRPGPPPVG